jgi:hypothetical protein
VPTVEDVRDNIAQIDDRTRYIVPTCIADEIRPLIKALR